MVVTASGRDPHIEVPLGSVRGWGRSRSGTVDLGAEALCVVQRHVLSQSDQ